MNDGWRDIVRRGLLARSSWRVGITTFSGVALGVPARSEGAGEAAAVFAPETVAYLRLRLWLCEGIGGVAVRIATAGEASRGELGASMVVFET